MVGGEAGSRGKGKAVLGRVVVGVIVGSGMLESGDRVVLGKEGLMVGIGNNPPAGRVGIDPPVGRVGLKDEGGMAFGMDGFARRLRAPELPWAFKNRTAKEMTKQRSQEIPILAKTTGNSSSLVLKVKIGS
ncbi:hypothetical protein MLD38_013702 [Melastoma candidum]|uniref:Uncharacterized protein n=1 Tax=Melastoma candidum TaxID=119954 RepID=A0ACB9RAE3_9MYRT|nr:hypothetical protein MLD38_013702 [Melastoma candidum]